MQLKITFHNMPHSDPLEAHAREKFAKIEELLSRMDNQRPMHAELWLKAQKQHNHHAVELHLKTPFLDLNAHDEGPDMYISLDHTIDKMVTQVKKEKEKHREKYQKANTEKKDFSR